MATNLPELAGASLKLPDASRNQLTSAGIRPEAVRLMADITEQRNKENSQQTIESLRRMGQQPPIPEDTVKKAITSFTENTKSETVPNPTKPGNPAETREVVAQNLADAQKKYMDKGYTECSPDEQAMLEQWVMQTIPFLPGYKDFFDSITNPTIKMTVIEDAAKSILLDPNFQTRFGGKFRGLLETQMPNIIKEAQDKKTDLENRRTTVQEQRDNAQRLRDEKKERINSFDDGKAPGRTRGSRFQELDRLEEQISLADKNDTNMRTYSELAGERELLISEGLDEDDPRIENLDTKIAAAKIAWDNSENAVKNLDQNKINKAALEKEIKEFNKKELSKEQAALGQLEDNLIVHNGSLRDLEGKITAADSEVTNATSQAVELEKKLQVALSGGILKETLPGYLADELEKAKQLEEAGAQRRLQEAKDSKSKAVAKAGLSRWATRGMTRGIIGGKREITMYDKKVTVIENNISVEKLQSDVDYNLLMREGTHGLMKVVLEEYGNVLGNFKDANEQAMFQSEIPSILNDKDFMKSQGTELAYTLLQQRRFAGRKIDAKDFQFMASQPWGKDLAEKLIVGDPDINKKLAAAKAANLVPKDLTSGELLSYMRKNLPGGLLIAMLAILIGSAVGGLPALGAAAIGAGIGGGLSARGAGNMG